MLCGVCTSWPYELRASDIFSHVGLVCEVWGEMSGKSIDKDHIRPSLSGPATEHPHGDVNYLCFTTKTPGRAKQSLQRCKTFNAVSWLH